MATAKKMPNMWGTTAGGAQKGDSSLTGAMRELKEELGIEIVGDAKIRIPVSNTEDDYDLIIDEDAVNDEIDKSVNINYLDNKDS